METQVKRGPNYISNMRRSRSLLQKQLAALLGLKTDRCVAHYENGTAFPPFRTAVMLEIVLGARLSELYPDFYRECQDLIITRAQQLDSAAHRAIVSRLRQEDSPHAHTQSG
jgi:ribosome-binding protein aMBF1 (putative translation factor)